MTVSILTLVRNRNEMLTHLIDALDRSDVSPLELVVARAGGEDPGPVLEGTHRYGIELIELDDRGDRIQYSQARNLCARMARATNLIFMDADTFPSGPAIGVVDRTLDGVDCIALGEIAYLPFDPCTDWSDESLCEIARAHPDRPRPPAAGARRLDDGHHLVWGTFFGIRRATFAAIGGFDERFTGYAGEDTDLAFRARAMEVPVMLASGATVFHQHHDVFEPPVQQLRATVDNARRFRDRHGWWPMGGWLDEFERLGLIRREDDEVVVLRDPTEAEIAAARYISAKPFRPIPS